MSVLRMCYPSDEKPGAVGIQDSSIYMYVSQRPLLSALLFPE